MATLSRISQPVQWWTAFLILSFQSTVQFVCFVMDKYMGGLHSW